MRFYKKRIRVPTVVLGVIISLIVLGVIAAILFGVARRKQPNDPAESDPPAVSTEADQPNAEIPSIHPGTEQGGVETDPPGETEDCGFVSVDILEANSENEKENQPHIEGDVSILPGVKEETDEKTNR